jgi:5-methylcytosine-specific restriction protein A
MGLISRKKFIQNHGATCHNWRQAWAFKNEKEKVVIFGAWDMHTDVDRALILDESWERSRKGRKNAAYTEALEYIRLVEKGGYKLKTFLMFHSDAKKDEQGVGPAAIGDFDPKLMDCTLFREGDKWFANSGAPVFYIPEEIQDSEIYLEGSSKSVLVNSYERNPWARAKCIRFYGTTCCVCGFNFKDVYGEIGTDYIHVHHLKPLSEIKKVYKLNPVKDLRPICPNCHAMIHRIKPALTIGQLRTHRHISLPGDTK